jgi:transposase
MAKAKDKEKLLAHELYLQTNKTIEEIASIVGVNRLTVGGWVKEGKWKTIKEVQKQTPERVVQSMYAELEQLNKHIQNKDEGERFADAKIATSRNLIILGIKRMQQQIALPQYVAVLTKFLEHVQRMDIELSKLIAPIANDFLNDVAEASTKQD